MVTKFDKPISEEVNALNEHIANIGNVHFVTGLIRISAFNDIKSELISRFGNNFVVFASIYVSGDTSKNGTYLFIRSTSMSYDLKYFKPEGAL